jgi:hypothetical protein
MILLHLRKERTLDDFNNLHNIAQSTKGNTIFYVRYMLFK